MSLSLFIARRIYRESDGGKQVSRPAVLIAMRVLLLVWP